MEVISSAFEKATKYLMTIGVSDFIDIIIVAYLLYKSIWFVRKTNSYNLAKGIVLILAAFLLSDLFHLTMINYLLRKAFELGLIALLILFQPELRWAAHFQTARLPAAPRLRKRSIKPCRRAAICPHPGRARS